VLAGPAIRAEEPGSSPFALADALERAWRARDVPAYLALWVFNETEAREEESRFATSHLSAEESQITLERPGPLPLAAARIRLGAQIFTVSEPRGRAEEWSFAFEKTDLGWRITAREVRGVIDGLIHLSLDARGFRADGLSVQLPDFELRMARGTLFLSPEELGPTVLVFVGQGTVKVTPQPATEREQLRQFCGKPEMEERIKTMFMRIHPADLHKVLLPTRLDPDPAAASRYPNARRFYDQQVGRAFVLEAALPRSPWWTLPGLGDASVTFETARRGTLTFTVSRAEPEDISLFDRARRRQICIYASEGRGTRYNEDDRRAVDVVQHDLAVRFEPRRYFLEGEDRLRLRVLSPATTLNLRLEDALRVHSITSREGGRHLFFRVRGQNSVMVSLGVLGGTEGEVALTVRYSGLLRPAPVEQELLVQQSSQRITEEEVIVEEVLVYTNRQAWYPRVGTDDHALARLRFDVPEGYTVVTGGTRVGSESVEGRTTVEYRQDQPGKYITAVVGRLYELGTHSLGPLTLRAHAVGRTRDEAARMVERTGRILQFFTQEFGPLPYSSLNLVVIEAITPGGHSPPGTIVVAKRPLLLTGALRDDPASFHDLPDFFLAHELAHQWWGHGVAGQNYHERWLSEGFAQYAAARWIRQSKGEDAFRSVLARMARWALRKAHEGPISLGHRLGHLKDDPQIFRAIVYNKGAYVLHMLRSVVGDAAFREALVAFQTRYRFQKAGTDDLREALEAASGLDLTPYFREWVFGTNVLSLRVSRRTEAAGNTYRTTVVIEATGLPGPIPVEVSVPYPGGREKRVVTLEPVGGRFVIETPRPPGRVDVNADRGLLATVRGS
jgi:hypothetical protein